MSDNLIIDYINRFWITDVDARLQLFDFKTKYQFQTVPGVDQYNIPLYTTQTEPGSQTIGRYPVYQGFTGTCYINGVQVPLYTQRNLFFNLWPNVTQNLGVVAQGTGTASGAYSLTFPLQPGNSNPVNPPVSSLIRGHVDINGLISAGITSDPPVVSSAGAQTTIPAVPTTSVSSAIFITTTDSSGANVVVADSGQFLQGNVNYGLLMRPGDAPNGNTPLKNGYTTTLNTVNYLNGTATVLFTDASGNEITIPSGVDISVQCLYFQTGLPRAILFYNNTLTLRSPPDTQYLVELDAFLSPAAFLSTSAGLPFAYMAEYIARGTARKILADTGDWEQYDRYEPLFKEQELLVWKRGPQRS